MVKKRTVGREGSYCRIQLGDKNKTLVGEHMYHISYDYNMGKDVRKGKMSSIIISLEPVGIQRSKMLPFIS